MPRLALLPSRLALANKAVGHCGDEPVLLLSDANDPNDQPAACAGGPPDAPRNLGPPSSPTTAAELRCVDLLRRFIHSVLRRGRGTDATWSTRSRQAPVRAVPLRLNPGRPGWRVLADVRKSSLKNTRLQMKFAVEVATVKAPRYSAAVGRLGACGNPKSLPRSLGVHLEPGGVVHH